MNKTKHDLSAGTAKLNLDNLIQLAQSAAGLARVECERSLSYLQNSLIYSKPENRLRDAMNAAHNLASAANHAALAFENLHYLTEAKNRDEIIVVK